MYPNGNIYMYVQNVNRYISKCSVIFKQFDVYMSRNFSTYIYLRVSATCNFSWIDPRRLQTKWRPSGIQNVLIWSSILCWGSQKEQEVTCLWAKSTVPNSCVTGWMNMSKLCCCKLEWRNWEALHDQSRRGDWQLRYSSKSHHRRPYGNYIQRDEPVNLS